MPSKPMSFRKGMQGARGAYPAATLLPLTFAGFSLPHRLAGSRYPNFKPL